MFTPVIDLKVLTRSTVLRFSDTTGPDTGDGTKWDGIAGLNSSLVSAATLQITDPNGSIISLDVKASIAAAHPVIKDIIFPDQTGQWVDGYYTVLYNVLMTATAIIDVSDYSATVDGTIKIHSTAHLVQTGMSVSITGGAGKYTGFYSATKIDANNYYISHAFTGTDTSTSTPCYSNTFVPFVFSNVEMAIEKMYAIYAEMEEGSDSDDYLKQVEFCNGLLNALQSAITTTTAAKVNNIYGRITRILDYNNMDLIYK